MEKFKVLVVEDDPNDLFFLEQELRRANIEWDLAKDGRAAQTMVEDWSKSWDAILLNLKLPFVDGDKIAHWCHRERPGLPIVIVSGAVSADMGPRIAGLGTVLICMKPFQNLQLLLNIMQSNRMAFIKGKSNRSWKTTTFGILTICSSLFDAGRLLLDNDPTTWPGAMHFTWIFGGLGLIFATARMDKFVELLKPAGK